MGKLIITREKNWAGFLARVTCYANNQLICSLKNGEQITCDVSSEIFEFRAEFVSPEGATTMKSDTVYLNMSGCDYLHITIKPGFSKLKMDISNTKAMEIFTPTKEVGGYFGINENNRQWAIGKGDSLSLKNTIPYNYDDIINFELIENGNSVTTGGIGSAVAGGLLFGGVGAIVGGVVGGKNTHQICTDLMVKITVNNITAPVQYIKLITAPTGTASDAYEKAFKNAQEILSILQLICNQVESKKSAYTESAPVKELSSTDEIRKFKALLDDGIITEEEFNAKKKQLLGL